ncbi:response regulator [Segetibacter sp. 3557_3]|uniref:response regulator n=1 Tax=Segetibacter sp. 3557_3 TaxID=2547429 RepID=UPI001058625C|nr:response regulator [Segetibacter sp. 3557_3]TDH23086.1 response regulator [Segetibacter sp. 3557_3]
MIKAVLYWQHFYSHIIMGKKKVLIIDDEVDFCLLMQFYLSKKNCEVQISHTLKEGMGLLENDNPDIVILDNNLPDGLGWPAAKSILAVIPDVQLFLISANKSNNKPEISNSHFHVVEKPISITQIDNFLR